jgi:hypothetical protein
MSYTEQLQRVINEYIAAQRPWPATTREIAAWAIQRGLWKPQPAAMVRQCADELANAMREEYLVDPQGRTVRAKHVVREHQIALWADIRTASPEHMQMAFQQRRQQIVGDCRQLKVDVDSYNENYNHGEPIQMVFDFTNDIEELELATMTE